MTREGSKQDWRELAGALTEACDKMAGVIEHIAGRRIEGGCTECMAFEIIVVEPMGGFMLSIHTHHHVDCPIKAQYPDGAATPWPPREEG